MRYFREGTFITGVVSSGGRMFQAGNVPSEGGLFGVRNVASGRRRNFMSGMLLEEGWHYFSWGHYLKKGRLWVRDVT